MIVPELRFVGPEYDGAEGLLESLPDRLGRIMNHIAEKTYGDKTVIEPTNVEIAPIVIEEEGLFIIRAWHETQSSSGRIGILRPVEGTFNVEVDNIEGYMHHRVEGGQNYLLTTAETVALKHIEQMAFTHDKLSTPVDQEAI
jgi:hypothetical protein